MKLCIGFGELNKKFIYILFAILFKFLSNLIIGLRYSVLTSFKPLNEELSKSPIVYFSSCFTFCIIIGSLCFLISKNSQKRKEEKDKSLLGSLSKFNAYIVKKKKINIILFIIGLIFLYTEVYDILFYSSNLGGLDYWMFEIIILSIFMSIYFKYSTLLHHKISLYTCIISSFIIKIISNFLNSKNIGKVNMNIFEYVINKYGCWYIPFIIISFLLMCSLRALANTNIKYLVDILYISPFTILIDYGIFGLIFCLIYISFDVTPLGSLNIFNNNTINAIFYTILYGITNSLKILFEILIVCELSPFHIFAEYKIYYLLIQIILIFNGFNDDKAFIPFYSVEIISDIICFFGFLIYIEIIELRCCGLNRELKKNIIKRSISESNMKIFTGEEKENIKIYTDSNSIDDIELASE